MKLLLLFLLLTSSVSRSRAEAHDLPQLFSAVPDFRLGKTVPGRVPRADPGDG